MAETQSKIYPHFSVEPNKKPNRFYAFPLIGIIVKIVMLIPVFIEMVFLGIGAIGVLVINWFVISFTRKYWNTAYTYFVGLFKLGIKIKLFLYGLTDKYPGFDFNTNGLFELSIPKPEKPNIWLNIPLLGIFIRLIILIPYLIFNEVMERGTGVAILISWFAVLFTGKFPESLYEFEKDTIRVTTASSCFMVGLSDRYPSFAISMKHQTVKILLIIAGALLTVSNMRDQFTAHQERQRMYRDYYQNNNRQQFKYPTQPVRYNNTY